MRRLLLLLLVGGIGAGLCLGRTAQATVINVPGDQPTIQAGIDAAVDGDTVLVEPGVYPESLAVLSDGIHILGSDGPLNTTITPPSSYYAVNFVGARYCVIEGFTLEAGGSHRAVIATDAAVSLIRNCRLIGVWSSYAVVGSPNSTLSVKSCLFWKASTSNAIVTEGPGCQIVGNTLDLAGPGRKASSVESPTFELHADGWGDHSHLKTTV